MNDHVCSILLFVFSRPHYQVEFEYIENWPIQMPSVCFFIYIKWYNGARFLSCLTAFLMHSLPRLFVPEQDGKSLDTSPHL